jgi:two-component system cell cycle response regulator
MNQNEPKYHILAAAPSLVKGGLMAALENDHHYQVVHAESPAEALKLASNGSIDLILVDGDDGWISLPELVIRTKGTDADVPILVIRDGRVKAGDDRIWTIGIDDCIRHPVLAIELVHHVNRALKLRNLGRKCDELSKENQQLYQLAITDGLTKLVNRRYFSERLNSEFARVKRFGGRIGYVICDIDHFKKVNDTYGHAVGDRVLKQIAAILLASVRSIDTAGRYGGEEFVLMLPETELAGVVRVAEKIRSTVEAYDFTPDDPDELPGPAHITISLGAISYPEIKVNSSSDLMELADQALYQAKQNGRNRIECAKVER